MPRFPVARSLIIVSLGLALAACSRSQPNSMGLNLAGSGADGGAGAEGGPITPGSAREFSARVGDTVHFETDNTSLSPQAQQILATQAQWLNQYPQYRITIEGHADERGTREYNIALGAQRAESVKHFLGARGIDPRRIRAMSYGKERPVAVCANISCWSQNRRAVTVLDTGAVANYQQR
jgi:peptidoglycan-associated lipoprotein